MNLYNTLTQQLEPVTSNDGVMRMYVCGVTPYDTTHLGHAFTYVCFDTLARYLEFLGYQTITVENVTDIDDDILKRAAKVGMAWNELAERETQKFLMDMKALNVRPTTHYPRATQEIPKIIEMVTDLLAKGYAYERNGSVYYEVRHDPDFGELGHMDYAEMLATANERGNFPDDPNKRDPLDFVLWQAAKSSEPTWDSPWGAGRPGWHIECSAMSMRYLGSQIDIHSGGADLIFPHHTCEIAQSEHFSGVSPFVRYWFHIAMVRLDGEKMSKSLGNMLFVGELLKTYSANAIRYYLLTHKYRDPWDADNAETQLKAAETMLIRWQNALTAADGDSVEFDSIPYQGLFGGALDDDFDTARAISHLDELADGILAAAKAGYHIASAQQAFRLLAGVMGLQFG
jgi:L-cysteine:1D-myo-inositol 2-amino-2-deoxy-alpha-D-glucopyranoside ligase